MIYRKMGRNQVDVGVVGLGAEYLEFAPRKTIISIVDEAIDKGANYIDLFMASPGVRDNFGIALKGRRHKVMIAGHLGATFRNGQYYKSRDKAFCEKFFDDLLARLQTDYIDVLMLHFVDEPDDYEKVFASGGLLESALRLKKKGRARFIGLSGHYVPIALKAVNSGYINVLMFPMNPAFDTLPADTDIEAMWQDSSYEEVVIARNKSMPQRQELYHACAIQGVGLVAMKPYAAGRLFVKENPSGIVLTPVQCISYALSQPGVCSVVPGCKTAEEMEAALAFLDASEAEKDFSSINLSSAWRLKGSCVYCNHCLPCPAGIDIAVTTRLADTATYSMADSLVSEYEALSVQASECNECGVCTERCPFGVDIIANMNQAVEVFGK